MVDDIKTVLAIPSEDCTGCWCFGDCQFNTECGCRGMEGNRIVWKEVIIQEVSNDRPQGQVTEGVQRTEETEIQSSISS